MNTIDWGQAAVNNTIGFGQGAKIGGSSFSNTKSILLDGIDDFVTFGDISDIENINALSIGFWFKYNSISTSADGLITKDGLPRANGNWYISLQSNQVRFLLKTANGQDGLNSTTLSSGTWYHTLCVWNGSTMKIYINGTLSNSISVTNATGTLGSANDSVRIGRRINERLDGSIDEVAMWSNDQSANASAIGSTLPTDLSSYSPLHWWRCGDGDTSQTLTDNGSGGNDGTMTNFTTFSTDVPT